MGEGFFSRAFVSLHKQKRSQCWQVPHAAEQVQHGAKECVFSRPGMTSRMRGRDLKYTQPKRCAQSRRFLARKVTLDHTGWSSRRCMNRLPKVSSCRQQQAVLIGYIPPCQPCCIAGSDGVREQPSPLQQDVANSYIYKVLLWSENTTSGLDSLCNDST